MTAYFSESQKELIEGRLGGVHDFALGAPHVLDALGMASFGLLPCGVASKDGAQAFAWIPGVSNVQESHRLKQDWRADLEVIVVNTKEHRADAAVLQFGQCNAPIKGFAIEPSHEFL